MRESEAVNSMLCPVCRTGLALSDRSGIEIDYCPNCRGVWLDRGELDKIIERTEGSGEERAAKISHEHRPSGMKGKLMDMASSMLEDHDDRRRHSSSYEPYRKKKKKRPSLSDFFD